VELQHAGVLIAVGTSILGCTALFGTALAGFTSDRLGRRKPLVIASAAMIAAGVVPEIVHPGVAATFVFCTAGGLGYGVYLAVDQSLMVEVLPSQESAARDLGLLSVANTAPGVIAPILAGGLVNTVGYRGLFAAVVVLAVIGAALVIGIQRVR
jgi:MFS family permease